MILIRISGNIRGARAVEPLEQGEKRDAGQRRDPQNFGHLVKEAPGKDWGRLGPSSPFLSLLPS